MMKQKADFVCDTAGETLTVRIRGEIDHHTASDIRSGIDTLLFERRPRCLAMDMSAVTFMDSSGLGLIMGRYSVMKELGGEMVVCDPSPDIQGILTLAGMDRMVKVVYTRETPPSARADMPAHADMPARRSKTARKDRATDGTEGTQRAKAAKETQRAQGTERKVKRA